MVVEWVLGLLGRSVILVLVAGAAAWLQGRASAARRGLVWQGLTLGLAVLPVFLVAAPPWLPPVSVSAVHVPASLETLTTFRTAEGGRRAIASGGMRELFVGRRSGGERGTGGAPGTKPSIPWGAWLLGLWGAGWLVAAGRTVRSLVAARRMVVGSRIVEEGRVLGLVDEARELLEVRGRVVVRIGDPVGGPAVPMVCGFPVAQVLLPAGGEAWPETRLRSVLLHELAHVRRGDWVWLLLARWNCMLYWPNPLVWWAAARLKCESEAAADDRVLGAGVRPSDYATHLLEVLRELPRRPAVPSTVVAMAQGRVLHARLAAILAPGVPRSEPRRETVWGYRALLPAGLLAIGSVGVVVRSLPASNAAVAARPLGDAGRQPTGGLVSPMVPKQPAEAVSLPVVERRAAAGSPVLGGVEPMVSLPVSASAPELVGTLRDSLPGNAAEPPGKGAGTILVGGYSQEAFRWQVYGLNLARGGLEVFVPEGGLEVSVTRDLRTVTYSREQDGEATSHWVRGPGAAARQLLPFAATPVWSPDGRQFVCSRWVADGKGQGRWETQRYQADGNGGERLPLPEDVEVCDWAPKGSQLLGLVRRNDGETRIESVRTDGTERTVLLRGKRRFKAPRYSPDGSRIVYTALWDPATGQADDEVWVLDLATRRETRVYSAANAVPEVCWSPDGRQLALIVVKCERTEQGRRIEGRTYRIETMDASGGNRRTLAAFPWMARVGVPVWVE